MQPSTSTDKFSIPSTVNAVDTPAHKSTLWPQQEPNHIGRLLDCPPPPKRRGLVKGSVGWPAGIIPLLLHQRRVHGSRRHSVNADLAMTDLLRRGPRQSNQTMLAGVVRCVAGKP